MSAASIKSSEPSMEEILASIRRIIADDQESARTAAAAAFAAPPMREPASLRPEPALQPEPASQPEPAPQPEPASRPEPAPIPHATSADETASAREALDDSDLQFSPAPAPPPSVDTTRRPAPVHANGREAPKGLSLRGMESLVSSEATAAVGDAFGRLSHSILTGHSQTIEDLVRELLKPMLKSWLDDNLPPLVERLVRAEIERVARGH